MKKIAKRKDDGTYSFIGMMYNCASYFNINIHSECVQYIVNTFLENNYPCTFEEWIRGLCPSNKVFVIDKELLKEFYSDLLSYSDDLKTLQDLFMYLYDQEMRIDKKEKVLYTTTFNMSLKKRTKLNYIGIAREYERLCTLQHINHINWIDIDNCVECIASYGYNIDENYKYRANDINETANNIKGRLEQIFHF